MSFKQSGNNRVIQMRNLDVSKFNTDLYNSLHEFDSALSFSQNMARTMKKVLSHPKADIDTVLLAQRSIRAHISVESCPEHSGAKPFSQTFPELRKRA